MTAVYLNSPPHVELEVGTGAAVALDSSGWEDTVVWNPHTTMPDCYKSFWCVDPGAGGTGRGRAGSPCIESKGSWGGGAQTDGCARVRVSWGNESLGGKGRRRVGASS